MENILSTDCLELRPIQADDAQDIFAYRSNVEANQYQDFIPKSIEEVKDFIAEAAEEFDEEGTTFQLVIINKNTGDIIGDAGISFIDDQQVELTCTIDKFHQQKGYASETLITVIDFLFQTLEKHRIIASIDPRNLASEKLLARIGFRKEAHFVKSYFHNGQWLDDVQYGLIASEWED